MRGTPWGTADFVDKIAHGIASVSTPGHGGVMVSKGVAEKRLSDKARENALIYGGYYCFEEDCDWAIAARELPEVQAYFKVSDEDIQSTLHAWNPRYLGVTHEKASLNEGEAFLRSAYGTWHDKVPDGMVGVWVGVKPGERDYTQAGIVPRANYENMDTRGEALQREKVISLEGFVPVEGF